MISRKKMNSDLQRRWWRLERRRRRRGRRHQSRQKWPTVLTTRFFLTRTGFTSPTKVCQTGGKGWIINSSRCFKLWTQQRLLFFVCPSSLSLLTVFVFPRLRNSHLNAFFPIIQFLSGLLSLPPHPSLLTGPMPRLSLGVSCFHSGCFNV